MPAPIVLFVFARPDHTRRTLDALAKNDMAEQSDVVVYSDAARNEHEKVRVDSVRKLTRATMGFRSITLVERETNYGLARNIIEGVSEVCSKSSKAIVLEDDIVTSPFFLSYMNKSLDRYSHERQVWHINGYNYPIDPSSLNETFFSGNMNCWGWATWNDRWAHFTKNAGKLLKEWNRGEINRFNLDGIHDFWRQVELNGKGIINTWAIFWYATIFENHGLCLNPAKSMTVNIGIDGTGVHCGTGSRFDSDLASSWGANWPLEICEDQLAVSRIKKYFLTIRPPSYVRIVRKVRRIFKI